MSISDNIRSLRLKKEWTQEHLADLVGVNRSTVTQWETGWSKPRMGAIEKLAAVFGVTIAEMVDDGTAPSIRGALSPVASKPAYAPLLGRVHAGDPQDPTELDGPMVQLPAAIAEAHPDAYFLEVEGDCMDRVYPEGCLILVDPTQEPQNGSIAAVSIDGDDYVMRRLLRGTSTIVLSPESFNPEHQDVIITSASGRSVELVGTVVWFQSANEME